MAVTTSEPPPKRRPGRPTNLSRVAELPKVTPARPKAMRPYVAIAERYAAGVADGSIRACKWVQLACARHLRDKAAASGRYVWSATQAAQACAFLETLPHVEGAWTAATIRLEPWQCFLVCSLFGWRHRGEPMRRRFTTVYLEVGRKNAKSTIMAGLALYHLLHEGEAGAQVICGATTGDQARIVFSIAQRMIERSPALRAAGLVVFANQIVTADGVMKPVNARASSLDGLNPSCIVLDESHAQTFKLHDVLKSAQGARRNPLLLCPTTAGYDLLSVGYALRSALVTVLEQKVTAEHVLGLIYTIDEGDDWRDPAMWVKANPMLGVTPTVEWVTQYCADAQQAPGLEGEFRIKVCSEWANASHTWLSMTAWDACADPTLRLEQFAGEPCWIGLDLAQVNDIAAAALCFQRDGLIYAFFKGYLPRDVVEQRARAVPAYREWVRLGLIETTEGNLIDQRRIEQDVHAWCRQFQVQAIWCDRFDATRLLADLLAAGLPAAELTKNRLSMTAPARDLEARVLAGRFRHDGNGCLRWMASNVAVTRGVDDSLLPKKADAESPNKIDGIDAILTGMAAMLAQPPVPEYQILVL